jgi:hypothetical protein
METTNYSIVNYCTVMTADKIYFIVTFQKSNHLHVMRSMIQCGLLSNIASDNVM